MKEKTFNVEDASSTETADVLGLTRQRVSQLRSAGVLQNNGKRGRYDLTKTVPAYVAYLNDNGGGDAKTRLIIARTRKIEIQNDKAEGRLISIDDAKHILSVIYKGITDLSSTIPKNLAPKLAKVKTPFEARRLIEREFDEVREAISREAKACCGLDPDADEKEILAKLRRVG